MKIRVLGSHGSQLPNFHLCSFLINESFALEAGGLTSVLSLSEQIKIKNILITHSHLDHIKDIAFLADNIFARHSFPLKIISGKEVLKIIKKHLLNDKIWPDFTKIPDPQSPTLQYYPIQPNTPVVIEELELRIIKVNHLVPTFAFFISDSNSTVLFTGDMGPSAEIWKIANDTENLKAIFIDTAFPNNMSHIAQKSRHLTPLRLKEELTKLKKEVPVYSYHLKSIFEKEIEKELKGCCPQAEILREGKILIF